MKRICALVMAVLCILSAFTFTGVAAETTRPSNVKNVTTKVTDTTASVSWDAVKGATGYRFYMWNETDKKWNIGLSATDQLGVEISRLIPGKTYKFAVKTYRTVGKKNVWSKGYTEFSILTRPSDVAKVKATSKSNSVTLSWSKAEGAYAYRVYQYMPSTKSYKALKNTTKCTFTVEGLSQGKKYIFAVRPWAKDGKTISWAAKRTTVRTATQPKAPKEVKASKITADSVTLSWDKVNGATGYTVYIWNTTTKKWNVSSAKVTSTSVKINKLSPKKNYIFAVRPFIEYGSAKVMGKYTQVKLKTAAKPAATR